MKVPVVVKLVLVDCLTYQGFLFLSGDTTPPARSSPMVRDFADLADISVRFQAGSSCRRRRSTRARGISRSRKQRRPNTHSTIRTCQEPRRRARKPRPHLPPPRPRLRSLARGPRGTADYHDQHKLTQPAPGPDSSGVPRYEQKPQLRGHMKRLPR